MRNRAPLIANFLPGSFKRLKHERCHLQNRYRFPHNNGISPLFIFWAGGEDVESGRHTPDRKSKLPQRLKRTQSSSISFCRVQENSHDHKNHTRYHSRCAPDRWKFLEKRTGQTNNENSFAKVCNRFCDEFKFLLSSKLHLGASRMDLSLEGREGARRVFPSYFDGVYQIFRFPVKNVDGQRQRGQVATYDRGLL